MITLKTLPQATAQQVFDYVATHLLTQNAKSMGDFGGAETCMYRGTDGLSCAAGCLIADDEYLSNFEQSTWNTLNLDGLVPTAHIALISELQDTHDNYIVEDWKARLVYLADTFSLDPTVLDKF